LSIETTFSPILTKFVTFACAKQLLFWPQWVLAVREKRFFKLILKNEIKMNPRVTNVIPEENFTLLITFSNGEVKKFDVKPYLGIGILES